MGPKLPRPSRRVRGGTDALEAHRPGRRPPGMNAGVQGGRVSHWRPEIVRSPAIRRFTPGYLARAGTAPLRLCGSAPLRFVRSAIWVNLGDLWIISLCDGSALVPWRNCDGSVGCRLQSTGLEILRLARFAPSLRMTFRLVCQGQPIVMPSASSAGRTCDGPALMSWCLGGFAPLRCLSWLSRSFCRQEILRLGRFSPSLRMTCQPGCQGQPVVMSSGSSVDHCPLRWVRSSALICAICGFCALRWAATGPGARRNARSEHGSRHRGARGRQPHRRAGVAPRRGWCRRGPCRARRPTGRNC